MNFASFQNLFWTSGTSFNMQYINNLCANTVCILSLMRIYRTGRTKTECAIKHKNQSGGSLCPGLLGIGGRSLATTLLAFQFLCP